MDGQRRLLILSCSRQKRIDTLPLPAIQRYDGPTFRVFRRFQRESTTSETDVYILSARFGLISSSEAIPYYDQRMTEQRARELKPVVTNELNNLLLANRPQEIYVCAGKGYLNAIGLDDGRWRAHTQLKIATGSMGRRLSELRDWLNANHPSTQRQSKAGATSRIRICGVDIPMKADEAVQIIRMALTKQERAATRYQSWYVQLDDHRIAPKWFLSQLTGLPVGRFHTDAAIRVLTDLGIEVRYR